MKIGIFNKREDEEILALINKLCETNNFEIDNKNPDIAFILGGDGTFLKTVHKFIDRLDKVTFVGINCGSLGFFYDFSKEDVFDIFNLLKSGSYKVQELPLLKGVASYDEGEETIFAVNEIRIENPLHTLKCDVFVNKEQLEAYRGNGLLVSSTIGSSAYNRSLGGALVDNGLQLLELTEIAGISNNVNRSLGNSLVLPGDKVVTISGKLNDSVVCYDFANIKREDKLNKLVISYSDKKVRIIHSPDYSYISKIRKSFVL